MRALLLKQYRELEVAASDRVTFDSTVYCGRYYHCLRGEVNLCDQRPEPGEARAAGESR